MNHRRQPRHGGRPCSDNLEVFRVAEGFSWHVWLLGYNPAGLYTHWVKGRSKYCDPHGCIYNCGRDERFWKSYLPALVFDVDRDQWIAVVLEVTERLELDFRGVAKRGQVWELRREPQAGESHTPVRGVLREERPAKETPTPGDHLSIVAALYHVPSIALTHRCPLPDKLRVETVSAPPPAALKSAEEERDAVTKRLAEATAADSKRNGQRRSTVHYY